MKKIHKRNKLIAFIFFIWYNNFTNDKEIAYNEIPL